MHKKYEKNKSFFIQLTIYCYKKISKYDNMSNKQLIRLTEGDLHRIVKESVNQILTELDHRTYASAAQKRNLQR